MGLAAALAHRQDYLIARQGVVSGNIANASTPDYLTQDVEFKSLVNRAGSTLAPRTTNSRHLAQTSGAGSTGRIVENREGQTLNGNSVVIEEELLKLNDIQLSYGFITQLFQSHGRFQQIALGNGGR